MTGCPALERQMPVWPEGPSFLGLETVGSDMCRARSHRTDPCLVKGFGSWKSDHSTDGTAENWAAVAWFIAALLLQDIGPVFWRKGLGATLPPASARGDVG